MKILIVGGKSALAAVLKPILSEFAEVITAGREGCQLYLDLTQPWETFNIPNDIDVVINTAGSFGGKTFDGMFKTEDINVLGVLKLCYACTNAHVKQLVLVSSIFALLEKSSSFYSIYALSKKHSDEVAEIYCAANQLPLTIIRPSQFYGSGIDQRKHQPFLSAIIEKVANNEDVLIYGTNDALRNFIHVEDVARVIALAIQKKLEGTYTCMNPNNVSYSEIASAAIKAFQSSSVVKFIKEKPNIPDNIFDLDTTIFRLLDYYPKISILLGMEKEVAYRSVIE